MNNFDKEPSNNINNILESNTKFINGLLKMLNVEQEYSNQYIIAEVFLIIELEVLEQPNAIQIRISSKIINAGSLIIREKLKLNKDYAPIINSFLAVVLQNIISAPVDHNQN